jgi:16S rRNA (guanine527-N7)-methyltransferase
VSAAATSESELLAGQWAQLAGRTIPEFAENLQAFALLLEKWQRVQNLVSRETGDLWRRHMADSLQLLSFVRFADRMFLDLGSGGGFPGIPLAIALKDRGVRFTLVESNVRKASFLRTVAREIGLNVAVVNGRAESLEAGGVPRADVVTARAMAPLSRLCGFAAPHVQGGTRALFLKGADFRDELQEAAAAWAFDVIVHKNQIGSDGVVLELANLRPR